MKRIQTSGTISLIPVIEIEPYGISSRKVPDHCPAREHPEIWQKYFDECVADAGYHNINPIAKGSRFVHASAIVENKIFESLLDDCLPEGDKPLDLDEVSMLSGGYALIDEAKVLIEPQCCSDFSNLSSWQGIVENENNSFDIWIGHPQAVINRVQNEYIIQEGWEWNDPPDYLVEFSVSQSLLHAAIRKAETEEELLTQQIERKLISMPKFTTCSKILTRRLMGNFS